MDMSFIRHASTLGSDSKFINDYEILKKIQNKKYFYILFRSPTCPQCNATYHGNPIRIFLNFSVPNPEDPLQLLESLRKCIENDKKNTIKQISDITAKLKTCEKGNEALKRQFQTELQAEQEIRR